MTAATDIAAIDDGGLNVPSEVRTALTSIYGDSGAWSPTLYTNAPAQFTDFTVDCGGYMMMNLPGVVVVQFGLTMTGTGTIETVRGLPTLPSGYAYDGKGNASHTVGRAIFHDAGVAWNMRTLALHTDGYLYFRSLGGAATTASVNSGDNLAGYAWLPVVAV